jgi:tetratricopeptide (TPR) repeat protein
LTNKGQYEDARQRYDAAIRQNPGEWLLYMNRAGILAYQRKWAAAIQDCNTVLRLAPGILIAQVMRGQINEALGKYTEALADYDRIANITRHQYPHNFAFALNSRAWLRATCSSAPFRNGKQAVIDAKMACNCTSWDRSAYIDTLAASHAEAGDFDSAIHFEERAIKQLRPDKATIPDSQQRLTVYQNDLALYQRRLASYQRHQPWRSKSD